MIKGREPGMATVLLSQVIPVQGPFLFPPACFRKGSGDLGSSGALLPGGGCFLHRVTSCIPGPHRGSEQLTSPGQQPEDEGSALPVMLPVLGVPSWPGQQNA